MKMIYVKSWPQMFNPVLQGIKRFDYRLNDRDYQVGDSLIQCEYLPDKKEYTNRAFSVQILRIWKNEIPGLPENYCILELGQPNSFSIDSKYIPKEGFVEI